MVSAYGNTTLHSPREATFLATATDSNGVVVDNLELTYDMLNSDRSITLADLAGYWTSTIDEEAGIEITDAGVFTMTTGDCQSVGTVELTSSNNIIELALSTAGDTCEVTGDFTGFIVVEDDHEDGNDTAILNNSLVLVYSNSEFGYAYQAIEVTP